MFDVGADPWRSTGTAENYGSLIFSFNFYATHVEVNGLRLELNGNV